MIVKPVSSINELFEFFTKRYNQFPEHLRYSVAMQGKTALIEFLWAANLELMQKRRINGLYFFFVRDKDRVASGLGACYEYFPFCLEFLTYAVQGYFMTHYKAINFYLQEITKENWQRMQAFVYEKSNFYVKLLERKGFKKEGFIKKYDGRFNYYLMSKVR